MRHAWQDLSDAWHGAGINGQLAHNLEVLLQQMTHPWRYAPMRCPVAEG